MTSRIITYKTLKDAIRIAFEGDENIISFYDPHKVINSIDDIIEDVYKKIMDYDDGSINIHGVYEKNELIGYFVYRHKMLISFSISVKYRTRNYLRQFFGIIKDAIKGSFICYLFAKNIRAIKWLIKNNMHIVLNNGQIAQLIHI